MLSSLRIVHAAVCVTLLIIAAIVMSERAGFAQGYEQRWGYGVDLGMLVGTVDRTVFALGGNVDYFVSEDFSFGPMVQIAPGSALTQVNGWAVAKFHFRTKYVEVAPFTGPGLTWARVGAGRLRFKSDDDVSQSVVLGVEIGLGRIGEFALAASAMYSVYNLDFGTIKDKGSSAIMFGVRF